MNFYKISTIILILLLAGSWIYFLNRENGEQLSFLDEKGDRVSITQKDIDDLFLSQDILSLSPAFIEQLEEDNSKIDSTSGTPLPLRVARSNWRGFKNWNERRFNLRKEIKPNGFAFGKYRLRRMLHHIDSLNRKIAASGRLDSLIYGVRVNLSHTINPKNQSKKPNIDALFVPIMKNGKSYFDLSENTVSLKNSSDTLEILLNTSIPCPNNCNTLDGK